MPEFYTAYKPAPVEPSPAGEKEVPIFELQVNKKGLKELVKTDKVKNIYNIKQEYLEESKVENIIKRYTLGDESVLHKDTKDYFDTTAMPQTLAEWEGRRIQAQEIFKTLPLEVRKEYDYNPYEFYNDVAEGKAQERIDKVLPSSIKAKITEKKLEKLEPEQQPQEQPYPQYTPGGNL